MRRRDGATGTATTGTAGSRWDLVDGEDVIGTASARLLSTCADRNDRLAALSLLGLLLDHADEAGRVRLPLDALARELGVEADRAVRLLQRLVAIEAVRAEGDAVVVAGKPADAEGSLRPSRFLANLVTVLEREPEPARGGSRVAGAMTARPEPRPRRRVLAALGVAVAAMALATAPSGELTTSLRTVEPPAVARGRAPWATVPVPTASPTSPVPAPEERPAEIDESPPTEDSTSAAAPGARPAGRGSAGSPPLSHTGGRPQAGPSPRPEDPVPSPSGRPVDPSPSNPYRPGPSPATIAPARPEVPPEEGQPCPLGVPEAEVSGVRLLGAGPSGVLDLTGERILEVTGTVRNASEAALAVAGVEVSTGEGSNREVEVATPVPVAIPAGGTASWTTNLLAGPAPSLEPLIDVRVIGWSWTDPDLVAACPT